MNSCSKAIVVLLLLLFVMPVMADTSWTYSTAGTYTWQCPANVSMVWLTAIGGGSAGHGGWQNGGLQYRGYAGNTGELLNVTGISVTPLQNYTIVVGAGGPRHTTVTSSAATLSDAGGSSSAFNYVADGGAGAPGYTNDGNGGNTTPGYFSDVLGDAEDGQDVTTYVGGHVHAGYGEGGGGGAANDATNEVGYGGKGSTGIVIIYQQEYSIGNRPQFTADDTYISIGTNVQFTNQSTIRDTGNLTWTWDFGDGSTSTTAGNVSHVFSYYGTYTVSLTLSSDTGDATETKNEYITVAPSDNALDLKTEPKPVQFHVQTFWGEPLVDANVSIIGITTSTGSWDWVVSLLGIPLDEVALNGTAMYQTADSLGNTEFLMIPSAKYNVTTTLSGYTFPSFYITPHDERYTIVANINGTGWFASGNNTITQVNVTVNSTKIDDSTGQITITYDDEGDQTTGGSIYIYRANDTKGGARVLVDTLPITGNTFTNTTNVTFTEQFGGQDYTVSAEPVRTGDSTGTVVKTFTVWFKGKNVELGGFDATVLLWISLFIVIFTAMFGGATHAPQVAIMICVESWVFYAMGWLDPLTELASMGESGLPGVVGDAGLIVMLSMATLVAIIWNFREGKRKEKGT